MKKSLIALFTAAAVLTVPQIASASMLLAGFYDFAAPAATTSTTFSTATGNFSQPGVGGYGNWSGLITTTNAAGTTPQTGGSVATGGSTDQYFGSTDDSIWATGGSQGFEVPSLATANGALILSPTQSFIFSVTSNNPFKSRLDQLLFDVLRVSGSAGTSTGSLQYQINGSGYTNLVSNYDLNGDSTNTPLPFTLTRFTTSDYVDYNVDLTSLDLFLPAGGTIDFKFVWNSGSPMQVDNIGLVAAPEPGSMLALGCLVGSGAFLRIRRRGARNA
ncbi:MAG: hypothetical protein WCK77_24555 [Verrucomicrobiota bacterium]